MIRKLSVKTITCALAAASFGAAPVGASQSNVYLPTTGQYSGLEAANKINGALDALLTCNKGSVAPTNALGAVAKAGQCWLDDSNPSFLVKKRYSGSGWVVEGVVDVGATFWVPPMGGGGVGTISSATTTDLGGQPQSFLTVTGTTTISSFGSTMPTGAKVLIFSGVKTLTYNATSMILPGGLDIATADGDTAIAIPLGSGNWRITNYQRADGSALIVDKQLVGSVVHGMFATVPSKYVRATGQALSRATYPDYLTAVTRTQSGTRTSGNATITSVSDTSELGPGMPVEGTGINAGCTISTVTSSTIVLNSSSCVVSSGTANVTVFTTGYGSGGSGSTVGVPDCSGRVLAGTDSAGSTLSFATSTNKTGGNENKSLTISTGNLPAYTPVGSITGTPTVGVSYSATSNTAQAGGSFLADGTTALVNFPGGTRSNVTYNINMSGVGFSGNAQGGTSTPMSFSIAQPTLVVSCLVRVFGLNSPGNDNKNERPNQQSIWLSQLGAAPAPPPFLPG